MAHGHDWADKAVYAAWRHRGGSCCSLPGGGTANVVRLGNCDFVVWRCDGRHHSQVALCANSVEAAYALRAIMERASASQ